jgi:cyanophycinase
VTSRDLANSDYVRWAVETAELIWLAGGDQSTYVSNWANTSLIDALQSSYARGAVVGGLSAGCASMGEFVYNPLTADGALSADAIANPFDKTINIAHGFLGLDLFKGILTDTHFYQRDRMGRLMAFMARVVNDNQDATQGVNALLSIGVDEQTSFFVNSKGEVHMEGKGFAYVLLHDSQSDLEQCDSGKPLMYKDVMEKIVGPGDKFTLEDLRNPKKEVGSTHRLSVDGNYPSDPFTPSDPY